MDWGIIVSSLPELLEGAVVTVQITGLAVVLGLIVAIPLAVLRLHRNPLLWMPVYGFIFFFRGTPLLVQLFLIYYGSGQFVDALRAVGLWTFFSEAFFCGVLTLMLNTAAYTAEILRGAIQGVPYGEVEAARAFGMSGPLLYRRIIMPIAFRLAWPAYTNEVIFLLQASSLVSIITLMDITGVASKVAVRSFAFYELYLTAAVLYLVLVYIVLFAFKRVEHRIMRHLRPAGRTAVLASDSSTPPLLPGSGTLTPPDASAPLPGSGADTPHPGE